MQINVACVCGGMEGGSTLNLLFFPPSALMQAALDCSMAGLILARILSYVQNMSILFYNSEYRIVFYNWATIRTRLMARFLQWQNSQCAAISASVQSHS